MTVTPSTRLAIPVPDGSEDVAVPEDIGAVVAVLDPIAVAYDAGPIADRVDQSPGAPGPVGWVYIGTDDGTVAWSTGVGWLQLYPAVIPDGAVTAAKLASAAVTAAKLADGAVETGKLAASAVTAAKILDGTITAAKLAAALKPSEGAVNATEALRALGTGTGQALPGNHVSARPPAFSAVPTNGSGTVGAGDTFTRVAFGTEEWDYAGIYNPTFSRVQPNVAGEWLLQAMIRTEAIAAGHGLAVAVYKNGSLYRWLASVPGNGASVTSAGGTTTVQANGTSDTFDVWAMTSGPATRAVQVTGSFFQGHLVRASA